jgi:hypothetical protein
MAVMAVTMVLTAYHELRAETVSVVCDPTSSNCCSICGVVFKGTLAAVIVRP